MPVPLRQQNFLNLLKHHQDHLQREHRAKFDSNGNCLLEIPPSKVKTMTRQVEGVVAALVPVCMCTCVPVSPEGLLPTHILFKHFFSFSCFPR
jgi:hypothetical protein